MKNLSCPYLTLPCLTCPFPSTPPLVWEDTDMHINIRIFVGKCELRGGRYSRLIKMSQLIGGKPTSHGGDGKVIRLGHPLLSIAVTKLVTKFWSVVVSKSGRGKVGSILKPRTVLDTAPNNFLLQPVELLRGGGGCRAGAFSSRPVPPRSFFFPHHSGFGMSAFYPIAVIGYVHISMSCMAAHGQLQSLLNNVPAPLLSIMLCLLPYRWLCREVQRKHPQT